MLASVSFGEWLQRQRKARGLTQAQLARQLSCSTITLRKLEAEERRPSAELVARLLLIFDLPAAAQADFTRFARGDWRYSPGQPADHVPWQPAAGGPRSNLPLAPNALLGREAEIERVCAYLQKPGVRLVTMTGPPGIGKTRLSLEAARAARADFADGVCFVALAALDQPAQVAPTIFQALGYVESKNRFTAEQLVESIGDRQLLLVLDNLEHLVEACAPLVTRLLAACPQLKILTTSREALRVPGEWRYLVPPLAFPAPGTSVDAEAGAAFPALALLAERAGAANPDFRLQAGNVRELSAICAQLDGVPLAIEIVAPRLRLMSPQALLSQLGQPALLAVDGRRAVADRQKTLRAAIQWSYGLLSSQERSLLMALAVFSGGFTLEAAQQVSAGAAPPAADLFGGLLDKSLVQKIPGAGDETRFDLLMMIRQFALAELRQAGGESAARERHLAFYLALAEQADRAIHGPDQLDWIERIENDAANFQSALEWCVATQQARPGLRLLAALGWGWWLRGHYSKMRGWFERISALPGVEDHPADYARLLNRMACQGWNLSEDREALALLAESRQLWSALGEAGELGLADCLNWLGMVVCSSEGQVAEAMTLVERSLALYRKHGDAWGCAHSLLHAGDIVSRWRRSAEPLDTYRQAFALFDQAGDVWGKSQVYQSLGRVYLDLGDYAQARACFEQQMAADQRLQYASGIVNGLCDLGNWHLLQGQASQARDCYEQSQLACRRYGLQPDHNPLFCLCLLALQQGDDGLAQQRFIDLYHLAEARDKKRDVCDLLTGLAAVAARTGQPERAAQLSGAADAILAETGYQHPRLFRAQVDWRLQLARDQLGEPAFEALSAAGRAMGMAQALAYTFAGIDNPGLALPRPNHSG